MTQKLQGGIWVWTLGMQMGWSWASPHTRDYHLETGIVVNYENFLKPQIYQTHNKDTHNYFQTCKLFKYFKLFVVSFLKHLDAFLTDQEQNYAKISKLWAVNSVCHIPKQ